jgi:hypothetical protein
MRLLQAPPAAAAAMLAVLLTGCASGSTGGANTPCADINVSIGETSKDLSAAAISRGKISNFDVPFWVPGGVKARSALEDRQTRKIEGLETELAAKRQERASRCQRP